MRSKGGDGFVVSHLCSQSEHEWGTQFLAGMKSELGKIEEVCASLRERSGWLWEWSFI
jgi:hypothetical protein